MSRKMKNQDLAKAIQSDVGGKVSTIASFLSQVLHGKKTMPERWIKPIMSALECESFSHLLLLFPKIRTSISRGELFFEVAIRRNQGRIKAAARDRLFHIMEELRSYGVDLSVTIWMPSIDETVAEEGAEGDSET